MKNNYPTITISSEGETWLQKGQMWMYRNNLEQADENIPDGAIVNIISNDGTYYGTGFYSPISHITCRILSKNESELIDKSFFERRIRFAYDYRKTVEPNNLSNCRYVFGEADLLPGLVVDCYNDILVTQISNTGMEQHKQMIYDILLEVFKENGHIIQAIYERNDIKVREKEGLTSYKGFYYNPNNISPQTIINENGIQLQVDIENGQKTGYFLDQKSNRVLLRNIARNKRVLDCFSHTGGFALNAAYGNAKAVTAVDVSNTALQQGYQNAKLNHLEDKIQFVQADVFDYLEQLKVNEFDIIVLDPPAFTKSRKTVNSAYYGYKNINMKAMNVLRNGGYLITCSCSRFMETKLFEQMLLESAKECGVTLRQISVTQQNSDHPILWTMDETSYLKYFIFQIL
ncbi:class I SAM-dependent rRNA methyltransferase [uncultured Solobacterium sp.]|uniref:class I SAM-dependent rRNA methyltransferase n=1 Tax=uncultured Solobacterium sp. TaxID=747375 RepID=UPI0025CF62DC|nr:class I SAM-dependent rRNA methyltransferase [uncultured Solobacterium sp.]